MLRRVRTAILLVVSLAAVVGAASGGDAGAGDAPSYPAAMSVALGQHTGSMGGTDLEDGFLAPDPGPGKWSRIRWEGEGHVDCARGDFVYCLKNPNATYNTGYDGEGRAFERGAKLWIKAGGAYAYNLIVDRIEASDVKVTDVRVTQELPSVVASTATISSDLVNVGAAGDPDVQVVAWIQTADRAWDVRRNVAVPQSGTTTVELEWDLEGATGEALITVYTFGSIDGVFDEPTEHRWDVPADSSTASELNRERTTGPGPAQASADPDARSDEDAAVSVEVEAVDQRQGAEAGLCDGQPCTPEALA